jgi:hypothetical protein
MRWADAAQEKLTLDSALGVADGPGVIATMSVLMVSSSRICCAKAVTAMPTS